MVQDYIVKLEEMYFLEIREFYDCFFKDSRKTEEFIEQVLLFDWNERKPRQMMFQVQRFVSLATNIDKIYPVRDGLRILFLKCCMESLAKISNTSNKNFYKLFATCFSEEGKRCILNNFSLSSIEDSEKEYVEYSEIIIDDFLYIIKFMRDKVVHEGNYWDFQIFAHDNTSTWCTHICTNEQLLSSSTYENSNRRQVTYYFQTKLQFEEFRNFFVEACVNYIYDYIERLKKE